ncbi:MAG: hypothetical protein ACYDAZ_08595 [Thermoplasmataceae archaeon]
MNKLAASLLIIAFLILLEIPVHSETVGFQIPNKMTGYRVSVGYVLSITTIGLQNQSVEISVDNNNYSLGSEGSISFTNLSGLVTIIAPEGPYLLKVSIFPLPRVVEFYFVSGIALISLSVAMFVYNKMRGMKPWTLT